MRPEMTEREAFTVMGIITRVKRGTETPELFGEVWTRFESRGPKVEALSKSRRYYGVSFGTDDADVTDYLAGMEVPSEVPVAYEMEKRIVPAGRFAVFESPVDAIGACYQEIFTTWLPKAEAAYDPRRPVFEEYPDATPAEPVRIHIPIRASK